MSVLDSMQGFLEKHVGPIAHKVSSFKVVKGLMSGMMATMPVTLGVALLSIINGLPIPPLQAFLTGTGMSATIADVLVVTMNLGAIYMCASVSYSYGKVLENKGLTTTVASIGVLLLLIPLGHAEDGSTFITTRYLGSSGLFVALLVALSLGDGDGRAQMLFGVFAVAALRLMPSVRNIMTGWTAIKYNRYTIGILRDAAADCPPAPATPNPGKAAARSTRDFADTAPACGKTPEASPVPGTPTNAPGQHNTPERHNIPGRSDTIICSKFSGSPRP